MSVSLRRSRKVWSHPQSQGEINAKLEKERDSLSSATKRYKMRLENVEPTETQAILKGISSSITAL